MFPFLIYLTLLTLLENRENSLKSAKNTTENRGEVSYFFQTEAGSRKSEQCWEVQKSKGSSSSAFVKKRPKKIFCNLFSYCPFSFVTMYWLSSSAENCVSIAVCSSYANRCTPVHVYKRSIKTLNGQTKPLQIIILRIFKLLNCFNNVFQPLAVAMT